MALEFADSFDHMAASNIPAKWTTSSGGLALAGPGRIGYGQYVSVPQGPDGFLYRGVTPRSEYVVGFAYFVNQTGLGNGRIFSFQTNVGAEMGILGVTASGQIYYDDLNGHQYSSATGLLHAQTWCYIEADILFSAAATGSVTLRFNGVTVVSQGSVITSGNGSSCALLGPRNSAIGGGAFYDDLYVINKTAPNNTFLGDTKIVCLFPAGNGRVDGFSRFGGTASGNWTAVNENPPDGDSSYVYTATPGTVDDYTMTTLSNVQTVVAVQLCGYARKDDTPSRVLSLGIGDGANEFFDAGTSLNTSYAYVLRQLDTDPVTSAAWVAGNFGSRQLCAKLIS